MIDAAIAASVSDVGKETILSAASDSVIECEIVKAVTIFTTGQTRCAQRISAIRKQI